MQEPTEKPPIEYLGLLSVVIKRVFWETVFLRNILVLYFFLLVYRFESVLSIEPQNARAASNLALIYLDLQDMEKSEEMFLRTLQIDPTYRSTLYNLGVLYNRQRKYKEAMELLSKLATLYPDHLNGVQLLGDCFLRLQQQQKAEEMYKLVLRQNPNHTTALHNLGQFILDNYKSLKECMMTSFYYSLPQLK